MTKPGAVDPEARPPVEVRIRFERFPASIKGAFIARGADGNPHGIRLDWAELARLPSGPSRPVPTEDRPLDVAPARDLFVPFEVSIAELEPGWYELRSSVRVDAGESFTFAGRPFAISWTRNEVRRGTIPIGESVRVGGRAFNILRLEMQGDSAVVAWREASGGPSGDTPRRPEAEALLLADGQPLERLPEGTIPTPRSAEPGELRAASYPMPRSTRAAAVVIRLRTGDESAPLPVSLV
jgi:hypothetical protein